MRGHVFRRYPREVQIHISDATRPNACFLLVAAPPLEVFRRPWEQKSFVPFVLFSHFSLNPLKCMHLYYLLSFFHLKRAQNAGLDNTAI